MMGFFFIQGLAITDWDALSKGGLFFLGVRVAATIQRNKETYLDGRREDFACVLT